MEKETFVISLGGSLIIPDEIDVEFLKNFKELILAKVSEGHKFVIITGGGKICRRYQDKGKSIADLNSDELDWIGIYTTRLNAEFVKTLFGNLAFPNIITDPNLPINMDKPIILGGGWKPGFSTDLDAVLIAKQLNAKKIINLSNIDYAYDKDPNKFPDAKKIEQISWKEYRELIPEEWNPGLSTPFDPIASKLAEENNIEVAILNGKNIENFAKYLNGEEFLGTKIY